VAALEQLPAAGDGLDDPEPEVAALGWPGLSWTGDGALGAGRIRLRQMDPELTWFPPAVEEQSGYPLATFNRRWIGFIADELIIAGLLFVISAALDAFASDTREVLAVQIATAAMLLRVGYGLIFNPRGWSPGKRWMGLRIVRLNGNPPGLRYGVVRTAAAVISHDLFFAGYIWAAWDGKIQTWHDKLAGTYVVRIDEGIEGGTHVGWQRRDR